MQELRNAIPTGPSHVPDIALLITSIVENMVPLITAAVRQGLESDANDSSKRSRLGATPTHLRVGNIQPINLMHSYPPEDPNTELTPTDKALPRSPSPSPSPSPNKSAPTSSPALRSDDMEE